MSRRQKGSKVESDVVVPADLDDLIATTSDQDPEFRSAVEDAEARLDLLHHLASTRKYLKLSQSEVARRMDTRQSAVSELEQGVVEPRLSTLQRYARVLGFRLWTLPVRRSVVASYADRRFHYPSPSKVGVRVQNRRTSPDLSDQQQVPDHVTTIGNVHYVQFQRRDVSPLGGSLAERLNSAAAA